jgi:CheY-like chemotaxis protein
MEQYNLTPDTLDREKRIVLVCTGDGRLSSLVAELSRLDDRIQVERAGYGADALVLTSKLRPSLLLIEDALPDIPCAEIVKSLRRTGEQQRMVIICLTRLETRAQCLESGANECLELNSIPEADLAAKLVQHLDLPEKPSPEANAFQHERHSPRILVNLPAAVELYTVKSPSKRIHGQAVVENVGMGGAFLSSIRLENAFIPAEPFEILVKVNQAPLTDWQACTRVIRLHTNESLGAAVAFVKISKKNLKKIHALLK